VTDAVMNQWHYSYEWCALVGKQITKECASLINQGVSLKPNNKRVNSKTILGNQQKPYKRYSCRKRNRAKGADLGADLGCAD